MKTVKYQKNNNFCPFCNDKNYIVYASYKDNRNEIFQCFCEKHNKDFYVKKVINRKENEMNERQILQNEFGIYYIADKNGNVQYENNMILASENKELLEKYLRELI